MGGGNRIVLCLLGGDAAAYFTVFIKCMACDMGADRSLFHRTDDCDIRCIYDYDFSQTMEGKVVKSW